MASIQQLEKLHHIQKIFQHDRSLESVVAFQRVQAATQRTEQLIKQRAFLREERRRLRIATEKLDERKRAMRFISQPDWLASALHVPSTGTLDAAHPPRTIRINVGGLIFEAYEGTLRKDPSSLLNDLCSADPPVLADPDGCFVFNRDWWLFRYILAFLRDGTLPDDRTLLAQLYQEAGFWRLNEMMIAIEEEKLHLRHIDEKAQSHADAKDSAKGGVAERGPKKWWQTVPSWWRSVIEAELEKKKSEGKPQDWWSSKPKTDSKSGPKTDVKAEHSSVPVFTSTWGGSLSGGADDRSSSGGGTRYRDDVNVADIIDESDRDLMRNLRKKHPSLPPSKVVTDAMRRQLAAEQSAL